MIIFIFGLILFEAIGFIMLPKCGVSLEERKHISDNNVVEEKTYKRYQINRTRKSFLTR